MPDATRLYRAVAGRADDRWEGRWVLNRDYALQQAARWVTEHSAVLVDLGVEVAVIVPEEHIDLSPWLVADD